MLISLHKKKTEPTPEPGAFDLLLECHERIRRFTGANDPALPALQFQYGRYLLIACSRIACSLPLQLEQECGIDSLLGTVVLGSG